MAIRFNPNHLRSLPLYSAVTKSLAGVGLTASMLLATSTALATPQQASQPRLNGTTSDRLSKNVTYIPPPNTGTPEPTGGTGSRGGCLYHSDRPSLAGLVGQPHLMLTTSDRPVIWVYVPYSPEEAPMGTVSLQQGDDELYRGDFSLTATPGIVGISLPDTAPALALGQDYDWFVDIHCTAAIDDGTAADPEPAILEGFVQRVEISDALSIELANAQSGLDAVAAYGNYHIWYDLLTTMARLRLAAGANSAPDSRLNAAWADLLSDPDAVGLEPWATAPVVEEAIAESTAGETAARENVPGSLQPVTD